MTVLQVVQYSHQIILHVCLKKYVSSCFSLFTFWKENIKIVAPSLKDIKMLLFGHITQH